MESLLFHPKLVHLPIALGVLMPIISGALFVAWWRKWLPPRAWWLAVGLQVLLLGSGLLAMRTGQAQEERVERVVGERFIEAHEEAAERFMWGSALVLGLMAAAAVAGQRRAGPWLAGAATLGTVAVLGLGYQTGQAGGSLVYEHGAARAFTAPGAPALSNDDD